MNKKCKDSDGEKKPYKYKKMGERRPTCGQLPVIDPGRHLKKKSIVGVN